MLPVNIRHSDFVKKLVERLSQRAAHADLAKATQRAERER
jgi:hypothetical protein